MDDRDTLKRQLYRARRTLKLMEEESHESGTASLAELQLEIDEKQAEIASLQSRLAQLEDCRSNTFTDNIPLAPSIFVGRTTEIAYCIESLTPEERGWGVVIDGVGGIGKTALALKVAHTCRNGAWFDAYIFVAAKTCWHTAEGITEETLALSSLDGFIREFARLLKKEYILEITDPQERRQAMLDALRGRRVLFILDNLEVLSDKELHIIVEFLRKLPAPNKAIVTSRQRMGESGVVVQLEPLSEQEAITLMNEIGRRYGRVANELTRADMLLRLSLYEGSGGNPLAIHRTLGLVEEKGYALEEAVGYLQHAFRSKDMYASLFADTVRDMQAQDRTLLSTLAAFHTSVTPAVLKDATGLHASDVQLSLERLLTLSIAYDMAGGHYGLHPLTRTYVYTALGAGNEEIREVLGDVTLELSAYRKALHYWVSYANTYSLNHKDQAQSFQRLETEWTNLEAVAMSLRDMAGVPGTLLDREAAKLLNDMAVALRRFLRFRGYWDEWGRLSEWSYDAARSLGNWHEAGWRAYDVAFIYWNRGETDLASAWAEFMNEAMERGGTPRDKSIAKRLLGLVAEQRGDLQQAEQFYNQALDGCRNEGKPSDEISILNDLGDVARRQQQYDRAEEYYLQLFAKLEEMKDKANQAIYAGKLGILNLDRLEFIGLTRTRIVDARKWYELEMNLAQEAGRQDLVAQAQSGLARVLEKEGKYTEALPLAEQALQTRERLRHHGRMGTRELVMRLRDRK